MEQQAENICSHHGDEMIFPLVEHKGHNPMSGAAGRPESQRALEERRGNNQQKIQGRDKDFSCSICLDLLKDPVTIPCGHSYCMNCIKIFWDEEDMRGICSCPQCRETFLPRPVLKKNIMLASLVEKLKKTGLQSAPADHCYAGPEDEACDFCTGRKLKAIKSCLVCLASYCEKHLQPHYDETQLRNHKLVEPSKNLQENICARYSTVSAAAERTERQRELEERRGNIQQRIQDREKDVKLLQQEVETINHSADKTVEDSEKIFTELIRLLQKRSSDVKQQIRSQQETEVSRVKDVQEKLEQEITELKRKDAELEQLSHTEDHNQFLLNYPSLPALSESTKYSSFSFLLPYFQDMTDAVSTFREKLQNLLKDSWKNIPMTVTKENILLPEPKPEQQPTGRAGFLKYLCDITLDPNTAHRYLLLSEGNRKVVVMEQHPSYSSHPDRFTHCYQVLSRESLTGRCYWEVERSSRVYVAVAYKNISRAGGRSESGFGGNDKSWALNCYQNNSEFCHNNESTPISGPVSSRVGVYLDHEAGILSFYSVSESMTLIHRVQTRFTEPLHAGIWVCNIGGSAEFCKPNGQNPLEV
ncbi:tripartite motif-containing protein 16-like [Xiphophorus maculatus]|uniref:tripartite motif-containing protein 16-like n=1 Tax=Xiphophorus maculatus TaxID=8083 RepID=UPI000C6CDB79|nr:tripartite motif-containing protein 16-like [Xiphophorus maculatus]